jgi:6-phosphogluconolactonase
MRYRGLLIVLLFAGCGGGGGGNEGNITTVVVPRFAFVANQTSGSNPAGSGELSAFTVDASNGRLRHNGYVAVASGGGLTSVAVAPSNTLVYATNVSGIWGFKMDPSTGALTAIPGSPFSDGTANPKSVTVDPLGRFVYAVVAGGVSAYRIKDATTGVLEAVLPGSPFTAGTNPAAVTVEPSGRYVYVANQGSNDVSAFSIVTSSGASFGALNGLGGTVQAKTGPAAIGVEPSGRYVYVANNVSGNVSGYSINPDGTLKGFNTQPATAGGGPGSIAFDAAGKLLFVANQGSGEVSVFSIDSAGALGPLNASSGIGSFGVAVDPTGQFVYSVNKVPGDITTFSVTSSSGALGSNGSVAGRYSPGAIAITRGSSPVTYTPRFAYTANKDSNDVTVFSIAGSGALSAVGSPVPTGATGAFSIAADPAGRFLYVSHETNSKVSAFKIDQASGVPSAVGSLVNAGTAPDSITVDPSGRFVYTANVTSGDISAFTITQSGLTAGALTGGAVVASGGTEPSSVAVDPTGRFLYAANRITASVSAFKIDALTGALTGNGAVALSGASGSISLVVNPNGKFVYVANQSASVSTLSIDITNGTLTEITGTGLPVPTAPGPRSIAIDAAGKAVYTANENNSNVSAFSVGLTGLTTGLLTENTAAGSPFSVGGALRPIAIDLSGRFVYLGRYVASSVAAYSIDPSTAKLNLVGNTNTGTNTTGLAPFGITTTGTIQ